MQKYLAIFAFALLQDAKATSTLDHATEQDWYAKQDIQRAGNQYVPLAEKLTVHLIHHTHDDVGWLKTVDEYYSGVDNSMQRAEVFLILTTTIRHLL
jgi:alpha-mannosidase